MKWSNKGHQFDAQCQKWIGKKIYIWGAGETGKRILEELQFDIHIKGFIDSQKKGTIYSIPIVSPEVFFQSASLKDSIVIIGFSGDDVEKVKKTCEDNGFSFQNNLFVADGNFEKYELPKILVYISNKIFMFACGMNVTEKCTLKCKECTMSIPYITDPVDENLESLKQDIDLLFSKVDYVRDLQLLGGEPFLNKELLGFIKYIADRYEKKFYQIVVYTNGTVSLEAVMLKKLREYNVLIRLSDYSSVSANVAKRQNVFLEQLLEVGVSTEVIRADFWTKYGFENVNKKNVTDIQMTNLFDACQPGCWTIYHKKLYYCYAGHMAARRLNLSDDKDNYIDLETDNMSPKEIIEWYEGFSKNGYKEICRYCDGEYTINPNKAMVAEQIK